MELIERDRVRARKFDNYWNSSLRRVFEDIADKYDSANDFFSFGAWSHIRRRFIEGIPVKPGQKVLDVCAGTNAVAIDLLLKESSLEVTAVDRSKAMQVIGSRRAFSKGLRINSVIGDAHRLPFADNQFDVVTLEAATRHLIVGDVFKEIKRVLKPGGFFYHCDLVKPGNKFVAFIYYNYLRLMIPLTTLTFYRNNEFLGVRDRALQLTGYFIEAIESFYTAEELELIMKNVGFENIATKKLAFGTVAVQQAQGG